MKFSGFIFLVILVMASNIKVDSVLAPLDNRIPMQEPEVLKAVAPVFIPFVFGESGTAQAELEVKINADGEVTSAQTINATPFRDVTYERAARKWRFTKIKQQTERIARLIFIMRIMPKGTPAEEITTIYTVPFQLEVRHEVFDTQLEALPRITKPTRQNRE